MTRKSLYMSKFKNFNPGVHDRTHLAPSQVAILNSNNLDSKLLCDYALKEFFRRLPRSYSKIYNFLVEDLVKNGVGHHTQGYVALKLGYCRSTVNKAFKKFKKHGLLNVLPRNNRSSLYALPERIRHDKTLKNRLSKYFSSLGLVLSVLYLMASPVALSQKGTYSLIATSTQNIKSPPIYKKYSLKSISLKKTYVRKSEISNGETTFSMSNEKPAPELTPEERHRIKTEERFRALQKDQARQEEKMRKKRDENLQALLDKGLITREQLAKILRDRK